MIYDGLEDIDQETSLWVDGNGNIPPAAYVRVGEYGNFRGVETGGNGD